MKSLCIYYDYWKSKNLNNIYHKGVHYKANPRDQEYMKTLVASCRPDVDFYVVEQAEDLHALKWDEYHDVVVAYPDAIGLGYLWIERFIQENVDPVKNITVMNGRRREIPFNRNNLTSLRLRRFLEKTLLGEIAFTLYFIAATPFFLVWDILHGKK